MSSAPQWPDEVRSPASGIFWREAELPSDPFARAEILMRRAPSLLPRFVSSEDACRYARSRPSGIERAFAAGVMELVYKRNPR